MPLLAEKSTPIAGLIGGWIVAADGYTDRGDTGDTEAYNPSASAWKSVAPDPTPRMASAAAPSVDNCTWPVATIMGRL